MGPNMLVRVLRLKRRQCHTFAEDSHNSLCGLPDISEDNKVTNYVYGKETFDTAGPHRCKRCLALVEVDRINASDA